MFAEAVEKESMLVGSPEPQEQEKFPLTYFFITASFIQHRE